VRWKESSAPSDRTVAQPMSLPAFYDIVAVELRMLERGKQE
jgi:hypothetical protein